MRGRGFRKGYASGGEDAEQGKSQQEVSVTSVDGAALVAAVGMLGAALLVLAHRLGAATARLAAEARRAELVRRAEEAEDALGEQAAVTAAARTNELDEVRTTV